MVLLVEISLRIELPKLKEIKMNQGKLLCTLMDIVSMSLIKLNSEQSRFLYPSNSCNNPHITSFVMENSRTVEEIEIGDNSFGFVDTVRISSIPSLEKVAIGKNSFTHHKNHYGKRKDTSFSISNCKALQSLTIESFIFFDYCCFSL